MPEGQKTFRYVAVSLDQGVRVEAKMKAPSEGDVSGALLRAGYVPLEVEQTASVGFDSSLAEIRQALGNTEPKMKTQELAQFTRQLHQLLKAGISISASVAMMADGTKDPNKQQMLRTISERLISGVPLAQAFSGFPKAFSEVFVAYMESGEKSGDLVEVTKRLANILSKRAEIQREVKAVSMYPMLVSGAIVAMLALIILFIVPQYTEIYAGFDAELPRPTQWVVSFSRIFPVFAGVVVAAVVAFVAYNKKQKDNLEFGEKFDRVKFKVPIFGKLFHKMTVYRFTSTLSGALAAGVQQYDAVALAGSASASRWVRKVVPDLQHCIQTGRTLSSGLDEHGDLFPMTMRRMTETGEAAGELVEMLENVGDALEDEIDLTISTMSAKIEVALLAFMGGSVGAILMALYLPIIQLATTAGDKYGF
jgi:type IV pilus assembly protein PilC